MVASTPAGPQINGHQHKRSTSSVLKAMIPRNHKRNPSNGLALSSKKSENISPESIEPSKALPMLPSDHPHAKLPLKEVNQNRDRTRSSPRKSIEVYDEEKYKTERIRDWVRSSSPVADKPVEQPTEPRVLESDKSRKPKKSKSSTSLSAFLSRPKSSKGGKKENDKQSKEKENMTPPSPATTAPPPPIWAQFATQPKLDLGSRTTKIPLNDKLEVEKEMALYTPHDYSPSKGRNFYDYQPTLSQKAEPKARPKSAYSPSAFRQQSRSNGPVECSRPSTQGQDTASSGNSSDLDPRKASNDSSQGGITMAKRGSRVLAAVTAWNGKAKEPTVASKPVVLDAEAVESAFESLLDSRNIDWKMRKQLRALDTNIKASLVKQDKSGSASSVDGLTGQTGNLPRPTTAQISKTDDVTNQEQSSQSKEAGSPRKSRPRSLTFTLSKGDASSKKQKSARAASHVRNKSADHRLNHSASSKSLSSTAVSQGVSFLNRTPKQEVPEDFISYLQKVQKPQLVEVGRLQKLRQLLRNETVSWVDSFITKGGMTEIVSLLYRIIDIEWREEHEDTLFHHTLTCLKALLTTSLAMTHLHDVQSTLFPTLLRLLFSSGEEKKGPSEFSTRNIIISLLFTYLSASPTAARARTLLSYIRDPPPKDDAQLPIFIADMHRPRPYRVWCKEITDVTKEVFWIFLHHMNVIPYPVLPQSSAGDSTTAEDAYTTAHFPTPRPPVPAAPYVGGVEWEATTYLATHIDLLNGLIASLPTREERNALRQELKDSGFEKVMGGTLRTCKEKFYGGVHAGLSTWVGAAKEDGWAWRDVREGPPREERTRTRSSSPKKKEKPPMLEMPKLELGNGGGKSGEGDGAGGGIGEGWL